MSCREHRSEASAVRRHSATLPIGAGGRLALRLDAGRIRVEATPDRTDAEVEIEATAWGADAAAAERRLERLGIETKEGPGGGEVAVAAGSEDDHEDLEIAVTARVPLRSHLDLHLLAGGIEVDRLDGDLSIKTQAAAVALGRIGGALTVVGASGPLKVAHVGGPVRVEAKAGPIAIASAAGTVSAKQVAGPIEVHFTGQPQGESRIESIAGPIRVEIDRSVGVDVEAASRLGGVRVLGDLPPGERRREYRASVHGGGPALRIESKVGQIALAAGTPAGECASA